MNNTNMNNFKKYFLCNNIYIPEIEYLLIEILSAEQLSEILDENMEISDMHTLYEVYNSLFVGKNEFLIDIFGTTNIFETEDELIDFVRLMNSATEDKNLQLSESNFTLITYLECNDEIYTITDFEYNVLKNFLDFSEYIIENKIFIPEN